MIFADRKEAGEQLAGRLSAFANRKDVIVLSLLAGGAPIGFEISRHLNISFDIFLIYKYICNYNKNFVFGASCMDNIHYIDNIYANKLSIHSNTIEHMKKEAVIELSKLNNIYRHSKGFSNVEDKIVIIADDGTCSENDIYYAAKLLEKLYPRTILIATPLISQKFSDRMHGTIENIIYIAEYENEINISKCYENFSNVSDSEVKLLIERTNYLKPTH